ncbi:MAG TPA: hypothetical protein VI565_10225, partial [Burkholderiales bacterium]|nr:hypothetical protein [Burkholderiales bacterium]
PRMTPALPKPLQILSDICAQDGIAFEVLDGYSAHVARISKGGRSFLTGAGKVNIYPLNNAAAVTIARDKAFTHYVLREAGFAAPRGAHFFLTKERGRYRRPPGREHDDALRYAAELSRGFTLPLIVKPNTGSSAKLVTYVRSEAELRAALDEIAQDDEACIVQEFIEAPEFRLFLLDGEVAFCYRKTRALLTGDGQTSVRELFARMKGKPPSDAFLRHRLEKRSLTLESVLPAGAIIEADFVANISAGGLIAGFHEADADLRVWARKLARATKLRVAGIDVFSVSELRNLDDAIVTDVNGSPNLTTLHDLGHHDLVWNIWREILAKAFGKAESGGI